MNTTTETYERLNNFLLVLKRQGGLLNLSDFISKINPPYKGNIQPIIVNKGIVKWEQKGVYTVNEFEVTKDLINDILKECRSATNKNRDTKTKKVMKDTTPQPIVQTIVKEVPSANPFGFATFDAIIVEKGKVIIGDYTLEGNFMITKIDKDGSDN